MNGTLIQVWAIYKSFVRQDSSEGDQRGSSFKGQTHSDKTHESISDLDARLHHKSKKASKLRFMGPTLNDNRHGLIASAVVTRADGYAEREAVNAMVRDARRALPDKQTATMLGVDKGCGVQEFIKM